MKVTLEEILDYYVEYKLGEPEWVGMTFHYAQNENDCDYFEIQLLDPEELIDRS